MCRLDLHLGHPPRPRLEVVGYPRPRVQEVLRYQRRVLVLHLGALPYRMGFGRRRERYLP